MLSEIAQQQLLSDPLFIICLTDAIQAATRRNQIMDREGRALISEDKKTLLTTTAHR